MIRNKNRPDLPWNYKPRYVSAVATCAPPHGYRDRTRLLQWLNYEHAGVSHAPEEVSEEHREAHCVLAMHHQGNLHLELQKDGRSVPFKLEYGGETYALVLVPKSAKP